MQTEYRDSSFSTAYTLARMDNKPFHEFRSVWLTREKEIPAGTYPTDISVSKMQKRRISAGGI